MINPVEDSSPAVLGAIGLRRVVAVLCLTQITSWGILYYAFPVLLPSISTSTGWSTTMITAAFSSSLVVSALFGIAVGHVIDRFGPRKIMTSASLIAVPALAMISFAPNYVVFLLGWMTAGAAMSGTLYPPAFAALTHWAGRHRVRALTALTLIGGLASTVFAPLTAALNQTLDWRQTYLALLAILIAITVPAHWFGLNQPWSTHRHGPGHSKAVNAKPIWTSRPFILLTLVMTAATFSVYAVLINLVPLLNERGLTTSEAALALGLGGLGQVAGRLGYARFAARTGTTARTAIVLGFVAGTTALMAVLPGPLIALIAVSMLVGVGRGVFTLIQATAVSDRWGVRGFGRLNGILSAPGQFAAAVAPFAGAALADVSGSHTGAFLIMAGVAGAAAIGVFGTKPAGG